MWRWGSQNGQRVSTSDSCFAWSIHVCPAVVRQTPQQESKVSRCKLQSISRRNLWEGYQPTSDTEINQLINVQVSVFFGSTPNKRQENSVETAHVCEICNLPRKFRPERYPSWVIMKKHQLFLEVPIIGARWWFQPIWRNSHIGTFPSIFRGEKIQQSFTKLPQSTRRIIPAFVSGSYSWLVSPLCKVVPFQMAELYGL